MHRHGRWNADELFVPGFRDSRAPYGSFVVYEFGYPRAAAAPHGAARVHRAVAGVNTQGGYLNGSGAVCDEPAGCVRHLVGPQFTEGVTGPLYRAGFSRRLLPRYTLFPSIGG